MSQTIEEKNKALVLEAFDTLINERDYTAAERCGSTGYIQHSAYIAPGGGEGAVQKRASDVRRHVPGLKA